MATLKQKRTCGQRCEDFGHFMWNSDHGTFMGRTPVRWVFLTAYYVAFYAVTTALFCLSIWVLMYTLDPHAPDYQDRLTSPGVMVWPDQYGEDDIEVYYNMSDKANWMQKSNCLRDFLHPYNDTKQLHCNNYNCTKDRYFLQDHFLAPQHTKWACPFTQSMLGACSGLSDPTFGYNCSMPCVIVKMNRIISFLPNKGTGVAPRVNCTALTGKENVAKIEYFPTNGTIDLSYFPYYGRLAQPTYINPLVAVRFKLVGKMTAKIQCRVVADNIEYQNIHDPNEGKVEFFIKAER